MPLNHEKLEVYRDALSFNAKASLMIEPWGNRHAVSDQLTRAAGSVVENIAFASASYTGDKIRYIEYAIGSALECAACMDVAHVKGLINDATCLDEKRALCRHVGMLVALRRSWLKPSCVADGDTAEYTTRRDGLFPHEKLDVYRASLEAVRGVTTSRKFAEATAAAFRRIDEPVTSMVLNIAEGNGRFVDSERRRFFEVSLESAIKLAARLDVCVVSGVITAEDTIPWKALIERVAAMLSVMIDKPRREDSIRLTTRLATMDPVAGRYDR